MFFFFFFVVVVFTLHQLLMDPVFLENKKTMLIGERDRYFLHAKKGCTKLSCQLRHFLVSEEDGFIGKNIFSKSKHST